LATFPSQAALRPVHALATVAFIRRKENPHRFFSPWFRRLLVETHRSGY
jgi:hypothetical protein